VRNGLATLAPCRVASAVVFQSGGIADESGAVRWWTESVGVRTARLPTPRLRAARLPPGPPGPPPKKPTSALAIVLMIFGGLFVLGVGSCVVCVAVVSKAGHDVSAPATVAEAGPARAEAPFVTALVQLAGESEERQADRHDRR
jgi:hypothetical protein